MSIKTMLIFLDESAESKERLEVACGLAEHHGAHLNALAMSIQIHPFAAVALEGGAAGIDVEQIEQERIRAQSVAAAAKKRLQTRGVMGDTRWISHEQFGLREAASLQGRYADLIIAGQPTEGPYSSLREAALEGALFSSGRPMLVIPSNWRGPISVRNVIVAWDASREAARALSDAIPFLEAADKTTIVIVDPKPGHKGLGEDPGADIAPILARHCSNVSLDRIPSSGASIAQALVTRAKDASGDLIVMGGYGHSSLREALFGGVSREMIHQTSIPLLLSH